MSESDIVIQAEGLGKKYTIGHQAEKCGYTALRDVLMQSASGLWRKTKDLIQGKPIVQGDTVEEVWALKDVSFEIRRGEVVGIIGHNGAGKSTLLKVLSRITEPSAGRVTVKGRVASLLEVGTGFHPELTGRENIYLNGAIMGMSRQEIKIKFDEIVAFAEVENFLDTPVKRYSSGMYVRLAFAVAAHLEPEILVVDEVLAVGDAEFQKKAIGKMQDVSKGEGRTVLFVSHNMGAIQRLCKKAVLIVDGHIAGIGNTDKIIREYLNYNCKGANSTISLSENKNRIGNDNIFKNISILSEGQTTSNVRMGKDLKFVIEYEIVKCIKDPRIGIIISDEYGQRIVNFSPTHQSTKDLLRGIPYRGHIICDIRSHNLISGRYYATLVFANGNQDLDKIDSAISFDIVDSDVFGTGKVPTKHHGIIFLNAEWGIRAL